MEAWEVWCGLQRLPGTRCQALGASGWSLTVRFLPVARDVAAPAPEPWGDSVTAGTFVTEPFLPVFGARTSSAVTGPPSANSSQETRPKGLLSVRCRRTQWGLTVGWARGAPGQWYLQGREGDTLTPGGQGPPVPTPHSGLQPFLSRVESFRHWTTVSLKHPRGHLEGLLLSRVYFCVGLPVPGAIFLAGQMFLCLEKSTCVLLVSFTKHSKAS